MPSVINTNMPALFGQRSISESQRNLQRTLQQLSSGLQLNSAADDAAGLSISTRFSARISGLDQAFRNANDGISMAQVGEGALGEVEGNLQRIRELSMQAANGIYNDRDRAAIQKEVAALQQEVARVIDSTEFNGQKLIASEQSVSFQVGAGGASGSDTVSVETVDMGGTGRGIGSALGGAVDLASREGAMRSLDLVDRMIDRVSRARTNFGVAQNRFESTIGQLANEAVNLTASNSRIIDTDYARATAEMTRNQILNQAGVAMQGQANAQPSLIVNLLGSRVA
jgi:flagellin